MSATKDYAIDLANEELDGEDFGNVEYQERYEKVGVVTDMRYGMNDLEDLRKAMGNVVQQVGELCSLNSNAICICGSDEIAKDNMCYDCRHRDKKFCSSCNEWVDEEEMYCPDEGEDICIYCRD